MQFGRGLDKGTDRFIGMYVNGLTLDYGERGRKAVHRLLGDAQAAGLLPKPVTVEFAILPERAAKGTVERGCE